MAKTAVQISTTVPTKIFEEPSIKKVLDKVFDEQMEDALRERTDEIKESLDDSISSKLFFEEIALEFRYRFYELVLNEAVRLSLSKAGMADVRICIISLINKENVIKAIKGIVLVETIGELIRSLSTCPLQRGRLMNVVLELRKRFLSPDEMTMIYNPTI